jgi:adenylosuccinate lyase
LTWVAEGQERFERAVMECDDLLDRLATDSRLPLDRADLDALLADRLPFTGAATRQVAAVVAAVDAVVARYPDAAAYRPAAIL